MIFKKFAISFVIMLVAYSTINPALAEDDEEGRDHASPAPAQQQVIVRRVVDTQSNKEILNALNLTYGEIVSLQKENIALNAETEALTAEIQALKSNQEYLKANIEQLSIEQDRQNASIAWLASRKPPQRQYNLSFLRQGGLLGADSSDGSGARGIYSANELDSRVSPPIRSDEPFFIRIFRWLGIA
jgi:hypothetical protein